MINKTQHLLICLAEECAEVQQRVTKILRFGIGEIQPGQELDNGTRLTAEVTDLLAVLELLYAEGVPVFGGTTQDLKAKKEKVLHFMEYARECGELER